MGWIQTPWYRKMARMASTTFHIPLGFEALVHGRVHSGDFLPVEVRFGSL
jgi:hypothetical protein